MQLRIGILTVSDRVAAGSMDDAGGPAIVDAISGSEWQVTQRAVVPDDVGQIAGVLRDWSDRQSLDAIFTTGGTGLGPRDVTPQATEEVAERLVPGISTAILMASLNQTPFAMLSRAVAATRGTCLIVNLPGSPRGAAEGAAVVIPILEHAVSIMRGGTHGT